jgi:hypothetical protein
MRRILNLEKTSRGERDDQPSTRRQRHSTAFGRYCRSLLHVMMAPSSTSTSSATNTYSLRITTIDGWVYDVDDERRCLRRWRIDDKNEGRVIEDTLTNKTRLPLPTPSWPTGYEVPSAITVANKSNSKCAVS